MCLYACTQVDIPVPVGVFVQAIGQGGCVSTVSSQGLSLNLESEESACLHDLPALGLQAHAIISGFYVVTGDLNRVLKLSR